MQCAQLLPLGLQFFCLTAECLSFICADLQCQVDVAHIETRKQAVHSSKVRSMFLLVQWQPGDFIVSDNLAVAHEASPQTQMTVSDVGLRIMHRTTVAGQHHLHK